MVCAPKICCENIQKGHLPVFYLVTCLVQYKDSANTYNYDNQPSDILKDTQNCKVGAVQKIFMPSPNYFF